MLYTASLNVNWCHISDSEECLLEFYKLNNKTRNVSFSNPLYSVNVPRHTKILFDGSIENLFSNMIQQKGEQYPLSIILYGVFFVFFFSMKCENLFCGHYINNI